MSPSLTELHSYLRVNNAAARARRRDRMPDIAKMQRHPGPCFEKRFHALYSLLLCFFICHHVHSKIISP